MIQQNLYDILVSPLYTEKCTAFGEIGKYCFKIKMNSTKLQVKKAVEEIFDTKVIQVNIIKCKGKNKTFRGRKGKKPDFKKAIITLKKDKVIDFSARIK